MTDRNLFGHRILGKKLFAILTTQVASKDDFVRMLPQHIEHQLSLEKRHILFAAGPLKGEDETVRGFIVIRAESFDHAREIANQDPFHIHGVRSYELMEWTVNEGSFSLQVRLSDETIVFE